MYVKSGCTQRPRLLGNVQGVVVHASRDVDGSSTKGKETVTNGIGV
jgi:hypothetical protein